MRGGRFYSLVCKVVASASRVVASIFGSLCFYIYRVVTSKEWSLTRWLGVKSGRFLDSLVLKVGASIANVVAYIFRWVFNICGVVASI